MAFRGIDAIALSGRLSLRAVAEEHVDALHALIEANRDFLRPWMPWAGGEDLEGTRNFVRSAEAQLAADNGFPRGHRRGTRRHRGGSSAFAPGGCAQTGGATRRRLPAIWSSTRCSPKTGAAVAA